MRTNLRIFLVSLLALIASLALGPAALDERDPLPSWNDGPTKQAILGFVQMATDRNGRGLVPPPDRIASFDNDGTLWPSHPMYTQLAFALDRIKALAPAALGLEDQTALPGGA